MTTDMSKKYYVKRGSQQFTSISSLFGGVRILKIDGMTGVGSAKNVYTASWVNSQKEDYMVAGSDVVRENVDIDITFIVGNKYGATNVREQHDAFIAYMTDGEMYIKSDYTGRTLRCVSLKDYKPTTVHLKRAGDTNDYIVGTITLHTLDNRAGDGDGYITNPYPTSGGDTPTPPAQQVSTTNVYDASLGSTQASLNQRFENKDGELETAIIGKQDKISDLEQIRYGASKGATAIQQHQSLDAYVNGGRYNNSTKNIELLHGNTVLVRIDASDFIVDGMVDDVRIERGYLVIDFNTDSGKQDISIPLTDIFNPNNYYNKQQINSQQESQDIEIAKKANVDDLADVAISGSYEDLTDKPDIPAMQVQADWNETRISEPSYIKNKPTIPIVPTNVSSFVNDAGYLVSSDLSGYVNGCRYNNQNERIELLHDSTVVAYINASDFAFSGTIDDVEVIDGNLVITFTTTIGQKSVSIPITSIFDPSNYYTKQQIDDIVDADTLHPITQQEFNEIFN